MDSPWSSVVIGHVPKHHRKIRGCDFVGASLVAPAIISQRAMVDSDTRKHRISFCTAHNFCNPWAQHDEVTKQILEYTAHEKSPPPPSCYCLSVRQLRWWGLVRGKALHFSSVHHEENSAWAYYRNTRRHHPGFETGIWDGHCAWRELH